MQVQVRVSRSGIKLAATSSGTSNSG